jgi:hypothetical protein
VTDPFRWDPELTKAGRGSSLLRDPLRLGLVSGAVVMAIGGFLPWAEGHIGFLPKQFGGLDGAADGTIMAGLAVVLVVIVRTPEFLESADGGRRWVPMIIGLASIALWLLGRQQAEAAIRSWEDDGGGGTLQVGYWVAGLGAAAVALFGSVASLGRRAGNVRISPPTVRRPRRTDLRPLAAALGALIGATAGAVLALALFPPITVALPILFFGSFGLVFGSFAGGSLGRRLAKLIG